VSASTIYQAANDPALIERVTAIAHQVRLTDATKADTDFGRSLVAAPPFSTAPSAVMPIMFPVAVDNEAAYESAVLAQRGCPGYDKDIITDANLQASVIAHWPMQNTVPPTP